MIAALTYDPWESGILDPTVHKSLVAKSDTYARDAGIPAPFIWSKSFDFLPRKDEQDWLNSYPKNRSKGHVGMVYLGGGFDPTIEVRMSAIAGKLVRNFIRGRVMTMEGVLQGMQTGDPPEATCLLLPTFTEARPNEKRASMVADLLLSRWKDGRSQTVLYSASLEAIGNVYGGFVRYHVAAHYVEIVGTPVKKVSR